VFDISAPAEYLVAGQQAQFTAVAHGPDGQPLSINSFNWSSSDPGVLSVDSQGLVTATGLGLATIKVAADSPLTGSTFGTLEMQVLPLRVTVTPGQTDMLVGQSLQFSAAAFDIRGRVIPNVAFVWEVSGENGFDTRVATITRDGTLKAAAAGQVSVRAAVVYAAREGKLSRFEGFASANIKLGARIRTHPVARARSAAGFLCAAAVARHIFHQRRRSNTIQRFARRARHRRFPLR
jgi:hypothetical protein